MNSVEKERMLLGKMQWVLNEAKRDEDGRVFIQPTTFDGPDPHRHAAELLCDLGLVAWLSDQEVRITARGRGILDLGESQTDIDDTHWDVALKKVNGGLSAVKVVTEMINKISELLG